MVLIRCSRCLSILACHEVDQIDDAVRVSVLVVVPRHQLDKGAGKHDTGLGVENRGMSVADKVRGDHLVFGVLHDPLHGSVSGLLDLGADFVVTGLLAQPDGQVDDGDVGRGYAEGHTG